MSRDAARRFRKDLHHSFTFRDRRHREMVESNEEAWSMAKLDRITRRGEVRRWRVSVLVLGTALALVPMACSSSGGESADRSSAERSTTSIGDGDRSSSTTTSSTSTTTATPTTTSVPTGSPINDEIITRYIGFWNARFEANSGVPNPDDPALRDFATGDQLTAVVDETRSNLQQGLAFRRPAKPAGIQTVTVVAVDSDHAVVQECVVADGVIVRRDTGAIVNADVATHNVRGELARVDGVWKVSSAQLVQRWDGVAGCARAS